MGQTAIDMPDPLEQGVSGGSMASTDDLLAQLAGEEVDRLLSDAEVGREPLAPFNPDLATEDAAGGSRGSEEAAGLKGSGTSAAAGVAISPIDPTEQSLDDLFKTLQEETDPQAADRSGSPMDRVEADLKGAADAQVEESMAGATELATEQSAGVEAQVDKEKQRGESAIESDSSMSLSGRAAALIDQSKQQGGALGTRGSAALGATDGGAAALAGAAPAEPASVADALAAEMEEDDRIHRRVRSDAAETAEVGAEGAGEVDSGTAAVAEIASADSAATTIDEELSDEPAHAEAAQAVIEAGDVDDEMEGESEAMRTPWLVRILEWINAPLAGFSEGAREAVGKAALVTTFNAVAILVYVMVFRKH